MRETQMHTVVREGYARVAKQKTRCCGPPGGGEAGIAKQIGYTDADLAGPAATGNLGLGCGNPTAIANLQPGEVVVDLGSGAGFDALLAAEKLGGDGRFIGVDMTPEMLARARSNAVNAGYARTVEFREGLIEALPVASESADVVISNCVINLSPDKATVFREAFRVLKPGGRLAISDILLTKPLPPEVAQSVAALIGCVAGAETEEVYVGHIRDAGFVDIELQRRPAGEILDMATDDPVIGSAIAEFGIERAKEVAGTVFSYTIHARKPSTRAGDKTVSTVVDDIVAFCRMFAMLEREQVCCGTVTVAQCVVLQTLLEGNWDPSTLASHTRVTRGAMTRLLDGLESRGFVERHQDPDDGRRWLIQLTAAGAKEARRLADTTENAVALIMSRMPKDMRMPAVAMIAELRKAAEEARDRIDCC